VLIIAAATLAFGYVAVGAAGVLIERPLLFPGAGKGRTPNLPAEAQLLRIPAKGREEVAYFFAPRAGARVVVHFHGNAEQLADLTGFADRFVREGLGFLAVEYPGYGLSAGEPTEASLDDAAQAALDYLREMLHVPTDRIVIEGQSIGTGVAVEMARRGLGSRLMLISPYTSVADLGKSVLPYHPRKLLVRDQFDSEAKAPTIVMPTLIIHGGRDEVVPTWMGRRLASLFPHSELLVVDDAEHNDLRPRPEVWQRLVAFAKER
jgi:hypothetical protein